MKILCHQVPTVPGGSFCSLQHIATFQQIIRLIFQSSAQLQQNLLALTVVFWVSFLCHSNSHLTSFRHVQQLLSPFGAFSVNFFPIDDYAGVDSAHVWIILVVTSFLLTIIPVMFPTYESY